MAYAIDTNGGNTSTTYKNLTSRDEAKDYQYNPATGRRYVTPAQ